MRRRDPCGLRRTESYPYDHFGRLVRRNENGMVFTFAYDAWGRRTRRAEFRLGGGETTEERRAYDKYGRLTEIASFGASVKLSYTYQDPMTGEECSGSVAVAEYIRNHVTMTCFHKIMEWEALKSFCLH